MTNRSQYIDKEGQLQKLSQNFFIGFQPKIWKIINQGTQLAYRNINNKQFVKVFDLKDIQIYEVVQEKQFQLQTPTRRFTLRAPTDLEKDSWIKTITQLKKDILKQQKQSKKKKKPQKVQFSTTIKTKPSTSYMMNPQSANKLQIASTTVNSTVQKHQKSKRQTSTINKTPEIIAQIKEQIHKKQHFLKQDNNNKINEDKQVHLEVIKKYKNVQVLKPPQNFHNTLKILQQFQHPEYFNKLPDHFLLNNIYLPHLRIKSTNASIFDMITGQTQKQLYYYLLISSKTLYPIKLHFHDDNLLNSMLPSWCQVDTFYRINNVIDQKKKYPTKTVERIFHVGELIEIINTKVDLSIGMNIGQQIHYVECINQQQKNELINLLEIAQINAKQTTSKSNKKCTKNSQQIKKHKRNFDNLIYLNQTNQSQFLEEIENFFNLYRPVKYQLQSLIQLLNNLKPLILQFIEVFQCKQNNKNHAIISILEYIHRELKVIIKITWDSAWGVLKGHQILDIMKGINQYLLTIKQYLSDPQCIEGMKQLSKIYVRESWKKFQSIILNIVQKQKVLIQQHSQGSQDQPLYSNGITDLYKFIYSVFQIAAPPWNHKLHLYNVNKLVQRALSVFVNEVQATVDEELIPNKQLAAIANNYFRVSEMTEDFYREKFSQLQESIKQNYDKIVRRYREISLIILDKLALDCQGCIRKYFQVTRFNSIELPVLYKQIVNESKQIVKYLHRVFSRKYFEKIVEVLKIQLFNNLVRHEITATIKSTANPKARQININRISNQLQAYKTQLAEMINALSTQKINKNRQLIEFQDIRNLLFNKRYEDVLNLMKNSSEPYKSIYKNIIVLRIDYHEGSVLFKSINQTHTQLNQSTRQNIFNLSRISSIQRRKVSENFSGSLSKYYMNEQSHEDKDISQDGQELLSKQVQIKLISEGYMQKAKLNKTIWQKLYFRLKQGTLYIFSNDTAELCLNSIKIQDISEKITVNDNKPSFLLTYTALGRTKQIKLKVDNTQLRDRWIKSIQLQKKRLKNDQQVKKRAIKLNSKGTKRNQLIIDYIQLSEGKEYFSYNS